MKEIIQYLKIIYSNIRFSKTIFYDDIRTTPINIFWEIQQGNFEHIIKKEGRIPSPSDLEQAYYSLMDSYFLHFKRSVEFMNEMKAKFEYGKLLYTYIQNPTANNKMFLDISKTNIEDNKLLTPNKQEDEEKMLGEYITHLEYNFNFNIEEETCSTYKFYNYLKTLKQQQTTIQNKD